MGNKVRCRFCQFEKDKKCSRKKNATVSTNKKRICKFYKADEEKIMDFFDRRTHLDSTYRPEWFWSRSRRKEERNRLIQQEMDQYQTTIEKDPKHPTTGDLSRFIKED
jgi:translation initiation factor 2 beta subunit (eIF-2beta)/eIF-5